MGEARRRQMAEDKLNTPNEFQVSEVSVMFVNGATFKTFSRTNRLNLISDFRVQKVVNGIVEIETGSKTDKYENVTIELPTEHILMFSVADVVRPSVIEKVSPIMRV